MTTYYISPSGNDSTGTGTNGAPWATLAKAITSSASGDTIILKDGTYTPSNWSITGSRNIQSENTGLAVINWSSASIIANVISISTNTVVTIQGLRFTNFVPSSGNPRLFGITLGNTGDVTIDSCTFDNCTLRPDYNAGNLIYCDATTDNRPLLVKNCLFVDIKKSTHTGQPQSPFCGNGRPLIEFRNCTLYFVTGASNQSFSSIFYNFSTGASWRWRNNNISNQTGVTMSQVSGTSVATTCNYNNLHNISSAVSGTGNIASDPLFVDVANGNFALRPTSPCLNTGTLV